LLFRDTNRSRNSLVGSGHLDKAAIISAAGDSVWSSSAGFTLQPQEMKLIADILSNAPGASDKAYAEGVFVGGARYVLTKVEGRSLYARKVRQTLRNNHWASPTIDHPTT
jgi:profilin